MDETTFLALVDEILEVEPGTTSIDALLDDIEWDSLANIGFIAEVDSKYELTVDADALSKCERISDLFSLLKDASAQK